MRRLKNLSCIWTAFLLGSQKRFSLLTKINRYQRQHEIEMGQPKKQRASSEQAATLVPGLSQGLSVGLRYFAKRNETKWYFAKWYFAKWYFAKWYFGRTNFYYKPVGAFSHLASLLLSLVLSLVLSPAAWLRSIVMVLSPSEFERKGLGHSRGISPLSGGPLLIGRLIH